MTYHRIGDRFGRWGEGYLHRCPEELAAEAERHGCTHIVFEDLKQIRERTSDGKRRQQWAFRELQEQVAYRADEHGIIVDTVEPSYTSQQCSKCGCTPEENRDGQRFARLYCSYSVNADDNAAKTVTRKLALEGRSVSTP